MRWANVSSDTVTGSREPQWTGDWNGISQRYGWLQGNTKADLIRELIFLIGTPLERGRETRATERKEDGGGGQGDWEGGGERARDRKKRDSHGRR